MGKFIFYIIGIIISLAMFVLGIFFSPQNPIFIAVGILGLVCASFLIYKIISRID